MASEKNADSRVAMAELMRAKAIVKELEMGNTTTLILFRSRGNWWKMGGNSALIYYYKVAELIGKTPKLHRDSDFFSKFSGDMISVKDVDKLASELDKIGIKYREGTEKDRLIRIFELVEECTEKELRKIRANEKRKIEKLNEIVEPKLLIPRVGVILKETTAMMYHLKIPTNNPRAVRLVDKMIDEGMEMVADYVMACKNNRGSIMELESSSEHISRLMTKIEMMRELGVWDIDKCMMMCDRLDEAQRLLNKRIRALIKKKAKEDEECTNEITPGDVSGEGSEATSEKARKRETERRERVRRIVTQKTDDSKSGGEEREKKD